MKVHNFKQVLDSDKFSNSLLCKPPSQKKKKKIWFEFSLILSLKFMQRLKQIMIYIIDNL